MVQRNQYSGQNKKRRGRKGRSLRKWLLAGGALLAAAVLIGSLFRPGGPFAEDVPVPDGIADYAGRHDIPVSDWPDELLKLYDQNPEARDFVLGYPENRDREFTIDLSEYAHTDHVPLLMQWDERWGYTRYAGELFGLSGCGPTCLSMVAIYLTGDTSLDPKKMGDFAAENGYVSWGNGTSWTLFSEGAAELGLDSTELPLDEQRIINNLEVGNPVVCVMGPGDFTTTGHFIILTGLEDGKFTVNDPNRRANSEKLWGYDEIKDQIRNLWAFQKKSDR